MCVYPKGDSGLPVLSSITIAALTASPAAATATMAASAAASSAAPAVPARGWSLTVVLFAGSTLVIVSVVSAVPTGSLTSPRVIVVSMATILIVI